MNSPPVFHSVVLGVSSVGKSFFIKKKMDSGDYNDGQNIIMANQLEKYPELLINSRCVVHYNALRPFENNPDLYPRDLQSDPVVSLLFLSSKISIVDILVASRSTIVGRIFGRYTTEEIFSPDPSGDYPMKRIYEFIARHDLAKIYTQWVKFFKDNKINYRFVSTEGEEAEVLDSTKSALVLLNSDKQFHFSSIAQKSILERFSFSYQGVEGEARRSTLGVIEEYLVGDSALDVGCAEGFFSFALESRGFSKVIGTETNIDRFLAASCLRDLNASNCRFLFKNIFEEPLTELFDVVLLLNVIHHLRNPLEVIMSLAKLCKTRLIIEYPTLTDPKFLMSLNCEISDLNNLPLIGVSDLIGMDQTFVFSNAALKRALVDNARIFKNIIFIQSPFSVSRSIAICEVSSA